MTYFPFLKAKRGELLALSNAQHEGPMTPVLDIPASYKEADGEKLLKRLVNVHINIEKSIEKSLHFYIDHFDHALESRLPGGYHPLGFHGRLLDEGYNIGFVTGLDRDSEYNAQVRRLREDYGVPLLLRLLVDDFEVPRLIESEIDDILKELGVRSDEVDVALDLRVCTEKSYTEKSDAAVRFLEFIEKKYSFPKVVISSALFPATLNEIVATGNEIFCDRVEAKIWSHIKSSYTGAIEIVYGDYSVVSPDYMDYEFKGPPPIAPKGIYTSLSEYFVKRCNSVLHHPRGYDQYIDIAESIVSLTCFRNSTYSFGDEFIYQKSTKVNKTGNPEQWITATVNQHIVFILRSIGSIYGP